MCIRDRVCVDHRTCSLCPQAMERSGGNVRHRFGFCRFQFQPPIQDVYKRQEVDRLAKMQSSNQEGTVIRTYLDTCLDLPLSLIHILMEKGKILH